MPLLFRGHFNPRPPRGGRPDSFRVINIQRTFQSTPPARGATRRMSVVFMTYLFQSTPPARGATQENRQEQEIQTISIHAPREGGDLTRAVVLMVDAFISIHAPREGGDTSVDWDCSGWFYFNPRPPRGGRPYDFAPGISKKKISIHAPREGGDCIDGCFAFQSWHFNPRPPRGGRLFRTGIGIHKTGHNFNPRPPRGGRLGQGKQKKQAGDISIHAPREGGDRTQHHRHAV